MRYQVPIPKTYSYVIDLIFHLIFLIASAIIAYSTIDSSQRNYVKTIKDLMINGTFSPRNHPKAHITLWNVSMKEANKAVKLIHFFLIFQITDFTSMHWWMYVKLTPVISIYDPQFGDGNSYYLIAPSLRQVSIVNGKTWQLK